ncbi:botulinum neurotoxin N-terminal receptor binding domain-containing protein [Bacillus cereus group sp. BceL062]|uniref:botulinum neurotoxin N-terminal receptor binding domain-containing protein n=1 Tax=Bacillus cereus group sp. BceL062 TaxID=3445166 RepID=UPI003F25F96F
MKINDSFKVNSPVNGKDIIMFNSPRSVDKNQSIDQTAKLYKGFQIANNIWVAPSRYKLDRDEKASGVYDPEYLTSIEEQQKFLDDIILIFKRINSTESGATFLSLLTAAVPFPYQGKTNYYGTNFLRDADQNQMLGMNIIIYGPDVNLMDFKAIPLNKNHATDGIGTSVEICFTPHLTFQARDYIQDPAINLWEQLIYAIHMLYGIKIPENHTIPYEVIQEGISSISYRSCEDILVAGGLDYRYAAKLPQWPYDYFQKTKDLIKDKVSLIEGEIKNDTSPNGTIPQEFYEFLQKKYSVDIQALWNITVEKCAAYLGIASPSISSFQNILNLVYYEVQFPKDYIQKGLPLNPKEQYSKKTSREIKGKPSKTLQYKYRDNTDKERVYSVDLYDFNFSTLSENSYPKTTIDSIINSNDSAALLEIESIDNIEYYGSDFISSIDGINSVIFDTSHKVMISDFDMINQGQNGTKNIITESPLPEHYLKTLSDTINAGAQRITLTNSLIEAIENKDKYYAYSPFVDFIEATNSLIKPNLFETIPQFTSIFYSEIRKIADRFIKGAEEIQVINEVKGVSFIVPWITPWVIPWINSGSKNSDNSKGQKTIDSLVKSINNSLHQEIASFVIPEVNSLDFESLKKISQDTSPDKIIENILKVRESQWGKMYDIISYQWWTTYNFPLRKIIYQARNFLYYQIQCALNNCYGYLDDVANTLKLDYQTQINLNKEMIGLKERMLQSAQRALENITEFILNCSISLLKNSLLPVVLAKLKDADNLSKKNLDVFYKTLQGKLSEQFDENITTEIPFDLTTLPTIQDLIQSHVFYNKQDSLFHLNIPDDDVNNIFDSSVNPVTIRPTGDSEIISGRTNNAIKFVAESPGTVQVPIQDMAANILSDFTIALWIKIASDGILSSKIITNTQNGENGYSLSLNDYDLIWSLVDDNKTKIKMEISNIIDGKWHHLAFTHNRLGNLNIYVDGNMYSTTDMRNLGNIHTNNSMQVQLNQEERQGEKTYLVIENLDVFKKDLNLKEIKSLYFNSFVDDFLRDMSGEVVTTDKEYILINNATPKKQMEFDKQQSNLYPILKNFNDKQRLDQAARIKLLNRSFPTNKKIKNKDLISINISDINQSYFDSDSKNKKICIQNVSNQNDAAQFQVICNRTLKEAGLLKLAPLTNSGQNFVGLLDYFVDNGELCLYLSDVQNEYNKWRDRLDNRQWALIAIESNEG